MSMTVATTVNSAAMDDIDVDAICWPHCNAGSSPAPVIVIFVNVADTFEKLYCNRTLKEVAQV